jgi:RHS repeat-associated protein
VSGTLNEVLYVCNDANMNVTGLVSAAGTVEERYVYDPYGKATCLDLNWANGQATSRVGNGILYCGYLYDWETGLYHVRRRYYHPTLGRWTARDPVTYASAGASLFAYCNLMPTVRQDPSGLDSIDVGPQGVKTKISGWIGSLGPDGGSLSLPVLSVSKSASLPMSNFVFNRVLHDWLGIGKGVGPGVTFQAKVQTKFDFAIKANIPLKECKTSLGPRTIEGPSLGFEDPSERDPNGPMIGAYLRWGVSWGKALRETATLTNKSGIGEMQFDASIIEFRKSNVTTRYPKGDGSLDASMRDRNLSWERRTRRLLA